MKRMDKRKEGTNKRAEMLSTTRSGNHSQETVNKVTLKSMLRQEMPTGHIRYCIVPEPEPLSLSTSGVSLISKSTSYLLHLRTFRFLIQFSKMAWPYP